MANSNADLIRTALVSAIEGIATTELGFDSASGSVASYLFEEEHTEKRTLFFINNVDGGSRENRKWAVQVYESEGFTGSRAARHLNSPKAERAYRIVIEGYYGFHTTNPVNTMMTHARKIRAAILALGLNLGGLVGRITDMSELRPVPENIPNVEGLVAVGRMEISAEKFAPTY